MTNVLKDLPTCFTRYDESSARCAACAFGELCRKLIYKSEIALLANQLLEKVDELERVNSRIELILGISNDTCANENATEGIISEE